MYTVIRITFKCVLICCYASYMLCVQICVELNNSTSGWIQAWDDRSKTPYAYNGEKIITYDNQRSIAEKVRLVWA